MKFNTEDNGSKSSAAKRQGSKVARLTLSIRRREKQACWHVYSIPTKHADIGYCPLRVRDQVPTDKYVLLV